MRFAPGILLFGLIPVSLLAQFSGRVTGSVVDASGASIPNAQVELYLAGGQKPLLSTRTSNDGHYNFISVRPANYDLGVESKGFLKVRLQNLTVDTARETSVPQIQLQLAAVTERWKFRPTCRGWNSPTPRSPTPSAWTRSGTCRCWTATCWPIMQTQPGVVSNGNSTTVINGLRTSRTPT